jgi:hypothetical protein
MNRQTDNLETCFLVANGKEYFARQPSFLCEETYKHVTDRGRMYSDKKLGIFFKSKSSKGEKAVSIIWENQSLYTR